MTIWTTLTKFGMNRLTKSEAKSIISKIELKPMETYANCVQRDLAKVMVEEKKPRRAQKIVEPEQFIIAEEHEVVNTENIE